MAALAALLLGPSTQAARLHVPADYPTIQDALDAAALSDTVVAAPGEHVAPIRSTKLFATIVGDGPPDQVIVRGDSTAPVVTVPPPNSLSLSSVTLTGGLHSHAGGGLRVEFGAHLALVDCRIVGNHSDTEGGGIGVTEGSSCYVARCVIEDNDATLRGGGLHATRSLVRIEDSVFRANRAHQGGAIYGLGPDSLVISGTEIRACEATESGGGLILYQAGTTRIDSCTFAANRAGWRGGGAVAVDAGRISVHASTFEGNLAALSSSIGSGGGMTFDGAIQARVQDCRFEGNFARSGGGARALNGAEVDFIDCQFIENLAGDPTRPGFGGGLNYWADAFGLVEGCRFERNVSSEEGGAIHIYEASALLTDLSVCGNHCLGRNSGVGWGGGIFIFNTFTEISESVVCNNTATQGGGGIYSQGFPYSGDRPSGAYIHDNVVEANRALFAGGMIACIHDSVLVENNVFKNNVADRYGGIAVNASSVATLRGNWIDGNVADGDETDHGGGGVFIGESVVDLSLNFVADNSAARGVGGGVRVTGDGAYARISDNVLARNHAATGGALQADSGARVEIERNLLKQNRCSEEGAAFSFASPCVGRVEHCTIVGSELDSLATHRGALVFLGPCGVDVRANIIADSRGLAAVHMTSAADTSTWTHNLHWNNEGGAYVGPLEPTFDIRADPAFVEGDSSYHLDSSSLAIDSAGLHGTEGANDIGWRQFAYPADPLLALSIEGVPDTVRPGVAIEATVTVASLAAHEITALVETVAAGWQVAEIDEPRELVLPPGQAARLGFNYPVPYQSPPAGLVMIVRARVDGRLEAGLATDLWIEERGLVSEPVDWSDRADR